MLLSPSLGPPLLSASWSPPLFCGIGLLVVGWGAGWVGWTTGVVGWTTGGLRAYASAWGSATVTD